MSGSLLPLGDNTPLLGNALPNYAAAPDPDQVTMAQGLGDLYSKVRSYIASQRAQSVQLGLLDPDSGLPTQAGMVDAARQYAQGLLMGTTAPGIKAFHGSPYDFDAFDASKIGTGEGAQAYGHGLYFAESPGVAQSYRDALAHAQTPQDMAAWYLHDAGGDRAAAIAQMTDHAVNGGIGASADEMANIRNGLQLLKSVAEIKPAAPGRMYEVNINADPQHFLDWDKPLSEQSQHVQDALQTHADLGGRQNWDDRATGEQIYKQITQDPTNREAASQLRFLGIPGIRYLDQGSRGAGQGTSNYVVFNPSIVSIARKYAVPAAVLSGTGAGLVQQGQQSQ